MNWNTRSYFFHLGIGTRDREIMQQLNGIRVIYIVLTGLLTLSENYTERHGNRGNAPEQLCPSLFLYIVYFLKN